MFKHKKALLLDMNSTFMFGEDRFDDEQDFSICYYQLGGNLSRDEINRAIRDVYRHLSDIYPTEQFRENFPSLESALFNLFDRKFPQTEIEKIIDTFAFHERGSIPPEYAVALHDLSSRFQLAVVIDIWSPKKLWLEEFARVGVSDLFLASSFSSDHGMVKPSPKPFQFVLEKLKVDKSQALVIGDSVRRDLGGARAAGIDCVLVGGAVHPDATANFSTLLEFARNCELSPMHV